MNKRIVVEVEWDVPSPSRNVARYVRARRTTKVLEAALLVARCAEKEAFGVMTGGQGAEAARILDGRCA